LYECFLREVIKGPGQCSLAKDQGQNLIHVRQTRAAGPDVYGRYGNLHSSNANRSEIKMWSDDRVLMYPNEYIADTFLFPEGLRAEVAY
jgi:hypothetical protein